MKPGRDFIHVIMTRFNMATPGREKEIRLKPNWLDIRFELFERYCLPSIASQSAEKDKFYWIVFFDKDTPEYYKNMIAYYQKSFPFFAYFTPIFPAEGWPRSLREVFGSSPAPWLLTTRFDSDDALSVDHVSRLHEALNSKNPERASWNLTNGFVMENGRLYHHEHRSNAFASWLEPWEGARTAMSINHMHMAEYGPVYQIGGPAAWLQVVHGRNVSNKVRGKRVDITLAHGRFPNEILSGLRPATRHEIMLENLFLTPFRSIRDRAISLLRGQPSLRQ